MLRYLKYKFIIIKHSLQFQLTLYNFILIIIPLVVTSIISYSIYKNSMLNEISDYSLKIVNQLNNNIDTYLEDMVGISILPMYDKDLQNFLQNGNGYDYTDQKNIDLYKQDKLHNFLFTLNNLRTEIDGVFIYSSEGKVYYNIRGKGIVGSGKINEKYDYTSSEWYKKAKAENGKSVIIGTHLQDQVLASDKRVFSIAKIIKDINYGTDIGSILIDVDLSKIEEICKGVIYSNRERIIILDNSDKIIYSSLGAEKIDAVNTGLKKMEGVEHGSYYSDLYGEEYLVTFTKSQYSEWRTVRLVPIVQLLHATQIIKRLTFVISMLSMFFAVLFLFFIAKKISYPIHKLKSKMELVEKGDFDVSVDIKSKNEIGMLGDKFNKMVTKLRDLVRTVYQVQIQNKEAQLIALQNQINPHFLYNTLDSIHMMAEINSDFEVSKMITTLAKLLRYSIKSSNDLVTIRDEIKHVKNYITIQEVRYENKFKFFLDIDKTLEEYKILKLILQPLVENCIYHGIKDNEAACYILVTAELEGDLITIRVIDNGMGMTEERLAEVKESIIKNDRNVEEKSIGICNVNNRIKTYFGEKFGLEVSSKQNAGTEISIHIPAVRPVDKG
jgi:two-component system, sensor histidine kinase YesM